MSSADLPSSVGRLSSIGSASRPRLSGEMSVEEFQNYYFLKEELVRFCREKGFVCSERHRAFFREKIGAGFRFVVPFQRWLKTNAGRTYGEAIKAYQEIMMEKARGDVAEEIGAQFEYNRYVRDFFADNRGRYGLREAIICWKYKRDLPGHNRYERTDLKALEG